MNDLDKSQLAESLSELAQDCQFINEPLTVSNAPADAEIISVFVTSQVTREVIDKMPALKFIACRSTGFNNVDTDVAKQKGVVVARVPTYGDHTVAEYTFTLLLALQRKLPATLKSLDDAEIDATSLRGVDLHGKVIGVVGTGHIGQNVIAIAKGFSMEVLAYDLFPKTQAQQQLGFKYVDIDELVKSSDVISLHIPFTPNNKHIINKQRLAMMKPTAVLINTARGELVDTGALADALSSGRIAGAALDVLEDERLLHLDEEIALLRSSNPQQQTLEHSVEIMALGKLPNVILTPHNAFNTTEAIGRINNTTATNIISFLRGKTDNPAEAEPISRGRLIITRHAESEWNATGKWTGIRDVHLSEKGFHESALLGLALQKADIKIDHAFCSQQIRALETLEGMLDSCRQFDVPIDRDGGLNERDYGDYTGKNKWEMKELLGEVAFDKLRRGWDQPVPKGETLKMVYERVVPFYEKQVLPLLEKGQNVLIVAHGNSLRSLMKYIERLSDQAVEDLEMLFGTLLIYEIDGNGFAVHREERMIDSPPPNA